MADGESTYGRGVLQCLPHSIRIYKLLLVRNLYSYVTNNATFQLSQLRPYSLPQITPGFSLFTPLPILFLPFFLQLFTLPHLTSYLFLRINYLHLVALQFLML